MERTAHSHVTFARQESDLEEGRTRTYSTSSDQDVFGEEIKRKKDLRVKALQVSSLLHLMKRTNSFMEHFDLDKQVKTDLRKKKHQANSPTNAASVNNSYSPKPPGSVYASHSTVMNSSQRNPPSSKFAFPEANENGTKCPSVYTDHSKLMSPAKSSKDINAFNSASSTSAGTNGLVPPAVAVFVNEEDMNTYWKEFGILRRKVLNPYTPALAASNTFVNTRKKLTTDTSTKDFSIIIGEDVSRKHFYRKPIINLNRDNEEFDKTLQNAKLISASMLADGSVEFSWEEFRLYMLAYPHEFCEALSQILQDKLFYSSFPESLFAELRRLVASQLFRPIKLLAMKNKVGAKLCLWCRRVIALLLDAHLNAVRQPPPPTVVPASLSATKVIEADLSQVGLISV